MQLLDASHLVYLISRVPCYSVKSTIPTLLPSSSRLGQIKMGIELSLSEMEEKGKAIGNWWFIPVSITGLSSHCSGLSSAPNFGEGK